MYHVVVKLQCVQSLPLSVFSLPSLHDKYQPLLPCTAITTKISLLGDKPTSLDAPKISHSRTRHGLWPFCCTYRRTVTASWGCYGPSEFRCGRVMPCCAICMSKLHQLSPILPLVCCAGEISRFYPKTTRQHHPPSTLSRSWLLLVSATAASPYLYGQIWATWLGSRST